MKTLLVKATIFDDDCKEFSVAKISLNDNDCKRIHDLSRTAIERDATLSEYDYTPILGNSNLNFNTTNIYPRGHFDEANVRVDGVELHVAKTDFYWSGYIKHTNIRWETALIPLKMLPGVKRSPVKRKPVSLGKLKKLLDYLETDEADHYESCSPEERKNHIYKVVQALRKEIA